MEMNQFWPKGKSRALVFCEVWPKFILNDINCGLNSNQCTSILSKR